VTRAQRAASLLAAAALIGSGCGGGSPAQQSGGPAGLTAGQLQAADCRDWKRLSLRERYAVLDQLEEVARGPEKKGATLPQQKAYDVIDARCSHYFARGFLLYEMYNRAASFFPLSGDG
jgi:hypothetical protein